MASASGFLRAATTPLVTVEETDTAIQKKAHFRAPGHFTGGGDRAFAHAAAKRQTIH
ncbi:MAG TPA: hypothetical protein VFG05_10075 [Methylocella sp.]|nr:hypothetical protein [Methylocella sp.]